MTTQRIGGTGTGTPVPARFGARLAGVAVAMPAGTPLEFIVGAAIFPLPLAPARVAGLMQLRGQPLVVLDASAVPAGGSVLCRRDVLVVGLPAQAAALLVDGPPQPLPEGSWRLADGPLPDCVFAQALRAGQTAAPTAGPATGRDRSGDPCAAASWYEIDPGRLFEALARN